MAALDQAVVRVTSARFEDQYHALYTAGYRVAYRLLGDRADAEDIAQETCARAYSRWPRICDYAEAWCVRVASNQALDRLRAGERSRHALQEQAGHRADDTIAANLRLDLYRALKQLPVRQRQVVILRYLGDLSEQQTADALNVSVGSVKTHGSRGLARLREVMAR